MHKSGAIFNSVQVQSTLFSVYDNCTVLYSSQGVKVYKLIPKQFPVYIIIIILYNKIEQVKNF